MKAFTGAVAAVALSLLAVLPAQAQGWRDNPKVKALYEDAKKEGQVIVWGTQRTEVEWIPAAFNALFPGIEVQWVGDNEIATKAIAEARAGRNQIDVYWHSLTGTLPLVQRDLIAVTDWSPFGIAKENTAFDGKMAYTSNIAYAIGFNPKLIKREDVPTTWDGLLDPKFKGKMVSSIFLLPRLSGGIAIAWGREKTTKWLRDMIAADIQVTRAPREPLINSGERPVGVGEIDSLVRQWTQGGLSIEYVIPEPVILGQFGANVMGKAPHPAAAKLLAGYLASPEGRAAREKATSQTDYGITGTSDFAKKINSGALKVVFDSIENMEPRDAAIKEMGPIVAGQK